MKQKHNARQRREAETRRRREAFSPEPPVPPPAKQIEPEPPKPVFRPERFPDRSPEEDTLEFLAYLDRYGTKAAKDDTHKQPRRKTPNALPVLNLEEGMPTVEEAVRRMNLGLQEMRVSRAKAVKLIHGYGSTGRGGGIRAGVRSELAAMKKRKLIRDWIPGEDFGPADVASRSLVDQEKSVSRDPDYGRMNPGVTMVVL